MLAALGVLGVLMAGLALPMAFGDDDDEEDRDATNDGEHAPTDGDEGQEIGADLTGQAPEGGANPGDGEDFLVDEAEPYPAGPPGEEGTEAVPPGDPAVEGLRLDGGAGDESLEGGAGDDDIGGGAGDDTLDGGVGDDRLFGDWGDDLLLGDAGDDRLADGMGDNTLRGGEGDDWLSAAPADGETAADGCDVLDGGAGDDTLILGPHDLATGGAGADTFVLGPGLLGPGLPEPDAGTPDGSNASDIVDFDAERDSLVVVWDDFSSSAPPEVALAPVDGAPDTVEVRVDGVTFARVAGGAGLSPGDVTLMPASLLPP